MKTTDKTISLEAAKLLGVAFRWPHMYTMRFVVTDEGMVMRTYRPERGWQYDERGRVDRQIEVDIVSKWFADYGKPYIVEGLPDDKTY